MTDEEIVQLHRGDAELAERIRNLVSSLNSALYDATIAGLVVNVDADVGYQVDRACPCIGVTVSRPVA